MKNQQYQKIEDLLQDSSFAHWVKNTRPDDIVFWENWIKNNPQHHQMVEDAKDIIKGIQFSPTSVSEDKVQLELEKLQQTIDSTRQTKKNQLTNKSKLLTRVAASVIFLLGTAACLFWLTQPQTILHQTAFGEKIDLDLPDGTQVALNANSSIRYFKENPREVWLEGEAFFEVKKKPLTDENFLVNTSDLTVEVLGTEFNVHTRKDKTQVVLEEGKVKLQLDNGQEKVMEPGDLISFSTKLNRVLEDKKITQPKTHTSWKDGTLFFENISLKDAMDQISEIYGVEINFNNNTISKKRIQIGVPTTDLDICIQAMEIACGIKINKEGNLLIINDLE